MRLVGVRGVRKSKQVLTTRTAKTTLLPSDLVNRRFTAPAPTRLWVCDVTHIAGSHTSRSAPTSTQGPEQLQDHGPSALDPAEREAGRRLQPESAQTPHRGWQTVRTRLRRQQARMRDHWHAAMRQFRPAGTPTLAALEDCVGGTGQCGPSTFTFPSSNGQRT